MRKELLRDASGEPVIWWHARRETRPPSVRAWLNIYDNCIGAEIIYRQKDFALGIDVSDGALSDHQITLMLKIPFWFALYLMIDRLPLVRYLPGIARRSSMRGRGERSLEIYWMASENFLHWRLWRNPNEGDSRDWRDRGLFIDDLIYGKSTYTKGNPIEVQCVVAMPEGNYDCTATGYMATWTRKRWKKPIYQYRVNLDFGNTPVPVPGDGENSWDCDDDGIYSSGRIADSIDQALLDFQADVIRQRGGWIPQRKD